MSKVSGSMDSVVLGVSEQVAHRRRPGQMGEQINFISDPVHGLVRRRGSEWQDERLVTSGTVAAAGPEANRMQEFTFVVDGTEYSFVYRNFASALGPEKFAYLYDKTNSKFLPIQYDNTTFVESLCNGGVSAITSVGRYVYIAGNNNIPTYSQVQHWNTTDNLRHLVAWIRGGAYSRTFSVTLTRTNGTTLVVSYKTKPSSYPTLLDTSGVAFYLPSPPAAANTPDPEYQKHINDLTYAYNSAAAQYIGIAAADITPENIAQQLVTLLTAAGVSCGRYAGNVLVDDPNFIDIAVDDGGDNTLMRAVGMEVSSPNSMTDVHYVGKVTKVRPQGSTDKEVYYLQAYPKDGQGTGIQEVVWKEAAGVTTTPITMFSQAVIVGGTMYVGRDAASLTAMTGQDHPPFKPSLVGDDASAPVPAFFGNRITMLAIFQDRLLIGTGGTINASRNGDYLNFFRQTVLDIRDDDPIEMYAYGSEGDTLRYAQMFDRNLVVFGDLKQYGISGQSVLSAKSPNISTMGSHEGSTATSPIASGNFVFYSKSSEGRTSLHQLQIGQLIESPVSYEVSQTLDTYLQGPPVQLCPMTSPDIVYLRTATIPNGFYLYEYLDDAGGGSRLYDSWSKWQFDGVLGTVCGISTFNGELLVYSLREANGFLYVVCDKVNLSNELSDKPYMDSMRAYGTLSGWHILRAEDMKIAADSSTVYRFLGTDYEDRAQFLEQLPGVSGLWVGQPCDAFVRPTNPYVRDQKGNAILAGRLTLTQVIPTVSDTGGLIGEVESVNGDRVEVVFTGRLLGRSTNLIGRQPIITGTVSGLSVGREVRECAYTFRSVTWLPVCITSLDWVGQYFNRVRRV